MISERQNIIVLEWTVEGVVEGAGGGGGGASRVVLLQKREAATGLSSTSRQHPQRIP